MVRIIWPDRTRAARRQVVPLMMRWDVGPDGLCCRWEVADAWHRPASARLLPRDRVAPRRLLRRLAQRQARAA